MAKWKVGPEMALVQYTPEGATEAVTKFYKEGADLETADDVNPSRTWIPVDAAAKAICKRIMSTFMAKPPDPDDVDDEKSMRKHARMIAKWTAQQSAIRRWNSSPEPRQEQQELPTSLHSMSQAQGKSVRSSDRSV